MNCAVKSFLYIVLPSVICFNIASAEVEADSLSPFIHGVASGDPLSDRVIIWTRLTTEFSDKSVRWQVATDLDFTNVINQGEFVTNASHDFTVKVDVTGLEPNTYYYYEFEHLGKKSVIGRASTLPVESVSGLRLALMSCTDYQQGYFNVYDRAVERNDFDYVLYVGDYLYELAYRTGVGVLVERTIDPEYEIVSLDDYRRRYAHYRLDESLQDLHQQYSWFVTWDDHEFANDAHMTGAKGHQPSTEGPWIDRAYAGAQAFHEWMPIRTDYSDLFKIYRTTSIGDLVDLIFIETRILGRTRNDNFQEDVFIANGWMQDRTNRSMLGATQLNWLKNELSYSDAKWKVMVSSIPYSPFNQSLAQAPTAIKYSPDLWDGNPAERKNISDHIVDGSIDNFVVLTGDRHSAWAWDIPLNSEIEYQSDGTGSIGVEFACAGVTSKGFAPNKIEQEFLDAMPYLKYGNPKDQGYSIVTFTQSKVQCDYYIVPDVTTVNSNEEFHAALYSPDGENHLIRDSSAFVTDKDYPDLAPQEPRSDGSIFVGIESNVITEFTISPNPAKDNIRLEFVLISQPGELDIKVYDVTGKVVVLREHFATNTGYNSIDIDTRDLSNALYVISIEQYGRKMLNEELLIRK